MKLKNLDKILAGKVPPSRLRKTLLKLFRRGRDDEYIKCISYERSKFEYIDGKAIISCYDPSGWDDEHFALEITRNDIGFIFTSKFQNHEKYKEILYVIGPDGVLSNPFPLKLEDIKYER